MPLSDYLVQICSICPKLTGKETNLFAKGLEVQILVPDDIFCVEAMYRRRWFVYQRAYSKRFTLILKAAASMSIFSVFSTNPKA